MQWKYLFFSIICLSIHFSQKDLIATSFKQQNKIILLTMPKAGTHLLQKAVGLITKRPVEWFKVENFNPEIALSESDNRIYLQHLMEHFDVILKDHSGKYIKVVLIRDPRDVMISLINWLERTNDWFHMPQEMMDTCNHLSFDEKLHYIMHLPDHYFSVRFFAKEALKWMEDKDVFVCRFEELVGIQGGGSYKQQKRVMRKLAAHLGYHLSKNEIKEISRSLFGGTATFRNGQINTWQQTFKQDHIQVCKEVMGKELIQLGYEKDDNW